VIREFVVASSLAACAPPVLTTPPSPAPIDPPSAERDHDRDGFVDPRDRCPREPGEPPHGCPDGDSDGDGVTTRHDRCPWHPGPAPDGCPPPDTDGDRVTDVDDRCPDALETRNGFHDRDGCPDEIPPDLAAFTGPIAGVRFELDSDVLLRSAEQILDRAVEVLRRHSDVRLEVVDHQDSMGSIDYSYDLSHRRARAVVGYLVARGLDPRRFEHFGAGPTEPLTSNRTAAGRARNRRVEFKILVE
jgi:outer membrane protein OmpA-like peptidoglycan-associated protein